MPDNTIEHLGLLEEAFRVVKRAEGVDKKVRAAVKAKTLAKAKGRALYDAALEKSVITSEEHAVLLRAEELRAAAIAGRRLLAGGVPQAQRARVVGVENVNDEDEASVA